MHTITKKESVKVTENKPLINYLPEERIRKIVARVSRGNISLQRGAYSTESDIEKRREKIAKYDFSRF